MDKIKTLLDKIGLLMPSSGNIPVLELDLLMDHTRKLYDELLQLKQASLQNPATDPVPEPAPVSQTSEDPEGQPGLPGEETDTTATAETATVSAPETPPAVVSEAPVTDTVVPETETPQGEENARVHIELPPAAETPAEHYARHITDFSLNNRDIRMYIGINDQYNFISELFGNNNEAYEEILDEINSFETQEDALHFLTNSGITTLYGWQEDHFSVRIFHNVLNQFFARR